MDLTGVAPAALTYFRVMFACMKMRRLGDTMYYWHRMQRAGIEPDVRHFKRLKLTMTAIGVASALMPMAGGHAMLLAGHAALGIVLDGRPLRITLALRMMTAKDESSASSRGG